METYNMEREVRKIYGDLLEGGWSDEEIIAIAQDLRTMASVIAAEASQEG